MHPDKYNRWVGWKNYGGKQQHSLVVLRVSVFVSSPPSAVTKVLDVGEDGGKKDQKAVKFSLLSKFLFDDLV